MLLANPDPRGHRDQPFAQRCRIPYAVAHDD